MTQAPAPSIEEQASLWAVRQDAGPLSDGERSEFEAWLAADDAHRDAYVLLRARWIDLDRHVAAAGATLPPASRRLQGRAMVAAAAILAFAVATAWFVTRDDGQAYVSGLGEIRRIALDDGSTLLLNTASEADVRFAEGLRAVRLERGEALFDVAHDPARPFQVSARGVTVRAIGTAFAVRVRDSGVDVTVTEGLVEVTGDGAPRRLAAGERTTVAAGEPSAIVALPQEQIERRLVWREGLVAFDGEPLSEAVKEINRHNRRQVVVGDPRLAARGVVGIFRATDIDGFALATATALGGRVVAEGEVVRILPTSATAATPP